MGIPGEEDLAKFACLAVREVLVLTICPNTGPMTDVRFEQAMEGAFGREFEPELRSQLHLVRSALCRLGQNFRFFERAAPNIFRCSTLEPDVMHAVFQAYRRRSTYVIAEERPPRRERLRRMPSLPPVRSTTKEVATQTDAPPINFEARAAQVVAAPQDGRFIACVICMDAHPDTALVPCGRLQTCFACAASVYGCPICRKKIRIRLKFVQD